MRGRTSEVLLVPNKRGGGGRKSVSNAEGLGRGLNKFGGSFFYTGARSFSHTDGGRSEIVHPLKVGVRKVLPCLDGVEGGVQKVSDLRYSHL